MDTPQTILLYSWQYDMRHFYAASLALAPPNFVCSLSFGLGTGLSWIVPGSHSTNLLPVVHNSAPIAKPMTVADVIKLSKAGLSDDTIIQQIKRKNQHFDLSTDQLIQLKDAHVSERVIQVMIDPMSGAVPPPAQKIGTPAAPVRPHLRRNKRADRMGRRTQRLRPRLAYTRRRKARGLRCLPEVVNWKTGGVMKSVATVGVVKGDVNGHVNGESSRNRLTTPIELMIVVPDGTAITEYQFLRLHQHSSGREFRTVTGGVFHVSGGATRDLLPFDGTKVSGRTYKVMLSGLSAGEYGFLPPGAFTSKNEASSGKIYSFRVIE